MTTAYTSLLGLALPVTGELSGTWGDTVNTAITSLLDTAVAGTTSITVDADITLSTTTGASNEARQAIILWNPASGTTTRYITAPAQSKLYTVINASGGTQSIVIRGVGPTTGVTIAKGESAMVAWNGSDFVKVSSSGGAITFTDLTVTGNTILGDAAADTLTVNATSTFASPVNFTGQVKLPSTGRSAAAALSPTNPAFLYGVASTYTDTTSSGTLSPVAAFYGFAQPTLSTSNVTTYTTAATLYIANAPAAGGSATITNPYALYVASGASYFGGAVTYAGGINFNGNVTVGDSSADTLTINSTITSNLIFTDNTYDIGASGATRPRNLYLSNNMTSTGIIVGSSGAAMSGDVTFQNNAGNSQTAKMIQSNAFGAAIRFAANGAVASDRNLQLGYVNNSAVFTSMLDIADGSVSFNNGAKWGSNFIFTPDNTYDIGASGANRPRTIYLSQHQYLGGNIYQNASTASNWDSNWNALQGSSGSFANLTTGQDLRIYLNGTIFGGVEKYVANGYAASMNIGATGTVWTNYASGTAGNNFSSVTGRMYFTQAGRLGVGYSVTQTPNTMISTLGGDFSVASTTSTGSANIGNLRSYSDYSGSNFELTRMEMNTKGAADDGEFAFYTRYGASLVQRLTLSVSGVVGTAFGANGITGPQYPFHGSNGSMGAADAVGWVGAAQPVSGSAYYGNGSGWLVGSITNNSARYWMGGISGHLIGGGTGGASTDESGGIAFWGKAAANASLTKTGYWDTGGLVVNNNLSVLGSTANFNNPTYAGFVMNINTGAAGNPAFGFGQVSDNPYIHMERWDGSSTFNAVRLKASNVTGGTLAFEFGTGSGRGTQSFNQKAFMNSSGSLSLSGSIIPTAATTSTYNINGVAANTWTTITSPGTLGTGAFYWVTFRWDHDGSGQPYILAGGFFFSCVNTNGSGGDNEFLPLTSSHTGAAGSYNISFRSLAGSTSNSGLQFKLNGFTGNGNLVVKYYYFASA